MRTLSVLSLAAVLALAAPVLSAPALAGSEGKQDIVVTAKKAGTFNTLLAALKAADLTKVLKGDGPFTVFAPTDEAFAKLDPAALQQLLADEAALSRVLLYHVVPGTYFATDVVGQSSLTTAASVSVPVLVDGSSVTVGGATVLKTDVRAKNGVIHVIDSVMLPPTD